MQEDAHEMGQIVLELLHVGSLAGLWVCQGFQLHLHLAIKVTFGASCSYQCTHDRPADNSNSCAVMLATEAAPWYQENAPGLIRTISAIFFPVGLIMIVLSGSDLFTSNVMVKMLLDSMSCIESSLMVRSSCSQLFYTAEPRSSVWRTSGLPPSWVTSPGCSSSWPLLLAVSL